MGGYGLKRLDNITVKDGAEGRSRTDTGCEARWILSPVRLPISPLRLDDTS